MVQGTAEGLLEECHEVFRRPAECHNIQLDSITKIFIPKLITCTSTTSNIVEI